MNEQSLYQFLHDLAARINFIVVSCAKQKIWDRLPEAGPTPAKDAYISTYFRLCRGFAEKYGTSWAVFSAKHGIIPPDFIIRENYDVSFKRQRSPFPATRLYRQLAEMNIKKFDRVVFLGGKSYYKKLEQVCRHLDCSLHNPLTHLFIGQRMKLLKSVLEI